MSKAEYIQKQIDALFAMMRKIKQDNNLEGVSLQERESNADKRYKMSREVSVLQKELRVERIIEQEEQRKNLEEEYGFIRHPRGDFKFRSTSWDDPLTFDQYQPSADEIKVRDNLIWQRYKEPGSLSSEQLVCSYRKFLGERLVLKHIASGLKGASFLSSKQLSFLGEYQNRAQSVSANTENNQQGGFLVPTDTEASIYRQMSQTGPFAGPMSELGTWLNFSSGSNRKINVKKDNQDFSQIHLESDDIFADKLEWIQKTISFENYPSYVPFTVQVDQDSATGLEQQIRMYLAESIGRGININIVHLTEGDHNSFVSLVNNRDIKRSVGSTRANVKSTVKSKIDNLKFLIDGYYRRNLQFVTTDDYAWVLEDALDEDGRFLYTDYDSNNRLLVRGVPVYTTNDFYEDLQPQSVTLEDRLDEIPDNTVLGVMGDFSKLLLGYVRGIRVDVLREVLMRSLQMAMIAHFRAGGGIVYDGRAFSKLTFTQSSG